jgi:hypothetical protein
MLEVSVVVVVVVTDMTESAARIMLTLRHAHFEARFALILKKPNPSRWTLLIDVPEKSRCWSKNVGHKECSPGRLFARLPERVRSLEKVAQRSTVALAMVRELPIGVSALSRCAD